MARNVRTVLDTQRFINAENAQRVMTSLSNAPRPPKMYDISSPTNGNVAAAIACIGRAESGSYTEHSHPESGSGWAQWIPSTWRTWSARAGYPGYPYAYMAPSAVQDAVLEFTLTHGGAGNWSNKFGRDSCTAGLPGGG